MAKKTRAGKPAAKLDVLVDIVKSLSEKVAQLEEKLNRQPPALPQKPPKRKRPEYLGEGVEKISKGRLDSNQVGGDQFIREFGTTQILPEIDDIP